MGMKGPRRFLLPAILVLVMGCILLVGGTAINQTDWPMYLGLACVVLAVCVAALIELLQAQHKRIAELERKLSEKQTPAEPSAAAEGGRESGS
jgi:hypothetical protein